MATRPTTQYGRSLRRGRDNTDFIPTIKVEGLAELRDKLLALGPALGARVLRSGARAAMQPVLEEARRLVAVDTGLTRDSITLRAKMPKSGDTLTRVGIKIQKLSAAKRAYSLKGTGGSRNLKKSTMRAYYRESAHWRWHFLEFGTKTQRAQPFLRPALAKHKDQVIAALRLEVAKRVERVWKYRRKQALMAKRVFGDY